MQQPIEEVVLSVLESEVNNNPPPSGPIQMTNPKQILFGHVIFQYEHSKDAQTCLPMRRLFIAYLMIH